MVRNTLQTTSAEVSELTGRFRLILFSGSSPEQLCRVAVLDCDHDGVDIVPYAPTDEYRVIPDLPPREAFVQAEAFISTHPSFRRSSLAKIVNENNVVVGFELRPLYTLPAFGMSDVLDISYYRKDQEISVSIRLQDAVERQLSGN